MSAATPPAARRPLGSGELLALAQAYHAQNNLAAAAHAYQNILKKSPANIAASTGLGLLHAQQGDRGTAEQYLRRVISLDPQAAEPCNILGGLLLAWGRTEAALTCFDAAVRLAPHIAAAHHNRAQALAALGQHDAAIAAYAQALAIAPDNAEIHNNFGRVLARTGAADAALGHFAQAVAIAPDFAAAQNNLGRAQARAGRHDLALHHLQQVRRLGPVTPVLLNDIATSQAALQDFPAAIANFQAACALQPDYAIAHSNLGNSLAATGKFEAAITAYRTAIALDPEFAEAHGNLGAALLELLHPADALPHLDRALALDPALPEIANARGHALVLLGDLEAAKASFARAVALRPGSAGFYSGLAATSRLAADDPNFRAMQNLARDTEPGADHIALNFALHKSYEAQERYAEAFFHLARGNALRRAAIAYDETAALGLIARIKSVFCKELLARAPPRTAAPDVPIFILGMPRSGSTLVEQILSSHPAVFGAGELRLLADAATSPVSALAYPENVIACTQAEFTMLGDTYRRRLRTHAPTAMRITDKMPANFHHIGLLRMILPDARIIHTRRDPMDTCFSCFAQCFGPGQPFANDLGELGRYYRAYAGLMQHWRETLPADVMLDVDYEALVTDFEPNIRRILAHCGLPWDDACRAFHNNPRPILTASATQVRQPIYQRSLHRSRNYEAALRPLKEALLF
jgi:tetratricopeptide (TPR) repeat protein